MAVSSPETLLSIGRRLQYRGGIEFTPVLGKKTGKVLPYVIVSA
jgi:hypothetical protein